MRSFIKILFVILLGNSVHSSSSWETDQSVKLTDVQVLTLYADRMTTGRRSSPIPQLKCVGGTAASEFRPKVVQCKNMGSDGVDVQWRCETDMSSDYRFSQLDVVCEGYRYPDDPYVLKGSCGLEYTLDFTEEGLRRHKLAKGSHYDKPSYGWRDSYLPKGEKKSGFFFADALLIIAACLIVYGIYKTCISGPRDLRTAHSTTGDDYPGAPGYGGGFFNNFFRRPGTYPSAPPPPGFAPEYTQGGASCGPGVAPGRSPFGGFWSGAATGGLLGYMFGARNSEPGMAGTSYTRTSRRSYTSPEPDAWGGTGTSSSYSTSQAETRTASGYGGTRRR